MFVQKTYYENKTATIDYEIVIVDIIVIINYYQSYPIKIHEIRRKKLTRPNVPQ
jgi:hypothetical protein